jgi:hypothetical protein
MAPGGTTLFETAMGVKPLDVPNVRQAVPFFGVKDIEASLRFYCSRGDGLLGGCVTPHADAGVR